MDSFELNLQKNFPERKLNGQLNLYHNIYKDQLSWEFYDAIGLYTQEEIDAIRTAVGLPLGPPTGSTLNDHETIDRMAAR